MSNEAQGHHPLLVAEGLQPPGWRGSPVDLKVQPGDRIGLLGPPGSGKGVLLRTLARLLRPRAGRLMWFGRDVTRWPRWLLGQRRDEVALLWANPYALFQDETQVRRIFQRTKSGETASLSSYLRDWGLSPAILDYQVRALSGVERVLLASAFAHRRGSKVILVDDVFQHLVPESWDRVISALTQVVGDAGALVIASRFTPVIDKMERSLLIS